jgi:hypothetical protein
VQQHEGDPVPDDVVHLPGDPASLGGHRRPPGPLLLADRLPCGQRLALRPRAFDTDPALALRVLAPATPT